MKKARPISTLFICIALILLTSTVSAQRYLGIATSDWCAINSLYLNPATIADCREEISIGLLSMNALVDNNLGSIPKIPDIGNAINNSNTIFTKTQNRNFSMLAPAAVVRGPGIMYSLNKKTSIAITSDIRAINQFNNFNPALYKIFSDSIGLPNGNFNAKAQNFNWTAHMWSEIGLTLGSVISEGYRHRLNFGITLRRLGGIGYISVVGKNMDLNYSRDSNQVSASNSDIEFSSNVVNGNSSEFKNLTPGGLLKKFFDETEGSGMSGDIGITYRYRFGEPEPSDYMESKITHDIIFSAAITDFGAIQYYNSTDAALKITGNGLLGGGNLHGSIKSLDSAIIYAHKHGFNVDTAAGSRKVYLPVALVTSADVQVHGRFFINLLFIGNLANRNRFGNAYYNQITLTPRYDFHKMTIALPLTYSMLAHDFKAGFALRYTGFFIGSDDFMAMLNKYQYGFNVYFGGYIPIFKIHNDPIGYHWGT